MSTGTITEAKRGTGDDATVRLEGRGEFAKWFVTITTDDSKTVKTSILRKPESPDPTGMPAEYNGKRWKLAQVGGNGRSGGANRSPAETKAIVRQHSQEMALRYVAIKVQMGVFAENFKPEDLKPVIDWFAEDAGS